MQVCQKLAVVFVLPHALVIALHLLRFGVHQTITENLRFVKNSSFILKSVAVEVLCDFFVIECWLFNSIAFDL